jgi:hypothetical protein
MTQLMSRACWVNLRCCTLLCSITGHKKGPCTLHLQLIYIRVVGHAQLVSWIIIYRCYWIVPILWRNLYHVASWLSKPLIWYNSTHAPRSRAVKRNSHHLVVTLKEYRVPATRQTINHHTIYNSSKLSFSSNYIIKNNSDKIKIRIKTENFFAVLPSFESPAASPSLLPLSCLLVHLHLTT